MRLAGEGQVARRLNGMISRLIAQQFKWETQNTPLLVAARLLASRASPFGPKVGAEARCQAGWNCSAALYHAPLDEYICCHSAESVVPRWIRVAASTSHAWESKLVICECCHPACCDACSSVCRSGRCAHLGDRCFHDRAR